MMKFLKQAICMAVIFGIVLIIPGYSSWDQFSFAILKMSISSTVLTLVLLTIVLTVYYRLKYWPFWTIVLGILTLFGSGVELPLFFALFPDDLSIESVTLTLAAVLLFWGIEKLVMKHEGSDNPAGGVGYSFTDPDEIITLNLDDKKKTVPKHTLLW